MNICIPIESAAVKEKVFHEDFSNPGVGGIEYLSVILAWYLALTFKDSHIRIITDYSFSLCINPKNLEIIEHDTRRIFDFDSDASQFWILIESIARKQYPQELKVRSNRIAIWSHHPSDWRVLAYNKIVDHLISTGEYQHYSNFKYFKYNHLINNLYFRQSARNVDTRSTSVNKDKGDSFNIMFLGALVPAKGFHHVLKFWNDIKKSIPNAYLHVIGGASLYGLTEHNEVNIPCEDVYARELLKIVEQNNLDMKDIKFYGSLGIERFEIYKIIDIAVINPTGVSESFSFNLHECFDFGIPVIASSDYGLNDTMKHLPQFTICNPADLVKKVVLAHNNRHLRSTYQIISNSIADRAQSRNAKTAMEWRMLTRGHIGSQSYQFNTYTRVKSLYRSYIGRFKFVIAKLIKFIFHSFSINV